MGLEIRQSRALLSSLYLLSFFLSQPCTATDTLNSSHAIKDGQTLVSAEEVFELGFFSPGDSHYRYVGIWYKRTPEPKYVWIANGQNPLTDSSGVLKIGANGNLVILDRMLNVVWATNISNSWNCSTAVLLDTGNLQLREADSDGSGNILWESFQHPSNKFLQNMKIGMNLKTGEKRFITSWKTDDDPAPGNFSFGLDPKNMLQSFIWNGNKPYWRSGYWNGRIFIGVPDMEFDSVYLNGLTVLADSHEGTVYMAFSLYNISPISIFELGTSGILRKLDWDGDNENWVIKWSGPASHGCAIYNRCGPFGRCNGSDNKRTCGCLYGFQPKYTEKWSRGDWSGGCVRRTELGCGKNSSAEEKEDGFLKMEKIKLPDFADWVVGLGANECGMECFKNCSCIAHAYVSGIGCFHWGGDLVDTEEFSYGGEELFLRLACSELGKKKKVPKIITIIVIIFGIIVTLVSSTCICYWVSSKQRGRNNRISELLDSGATDASKDSANANLVREGVMQEGPELPLFDLSKIAVATNNFSNANKIGEGGFGPVYKGKLPEGQEIAVKRLSKSSGQGLEEFKNEAIFISRLQHRNLVRLLGCCIEGEEKMLIYEYMPNKSLDSFLFDPKRQAQLDWAKRFHIVEGVARGLLYLHRDSRLRIIHRDLKASNILLDDEMNPKISDFGMAWSFGGNQTLAKTNKVVGTYGYMAPEYAKEGRFSEKSDIFSFGVLLLEIVSGRRNRSFYNQELSLNLLEYAWKLWNEDKASELIDPELGNSYTLSEVMRCIHVGLLCVQECASDRPTMSTIVFMLGTEIAILPTPMEPAATLERSPSESDVPLIRNIFSVNNISITTVHGR
ncbi:G-type lectin S-receptor-like serine/threonine-protein kinase At1g11300 [Magnolia sinica]|uniref:G-type lectin S-receptor-like serine/threonine-protein kinase At1g11300 n=1 Tax=Magnolia sinica TaxID=86752 RepID=UPI0026584DC9|nr:G-type lectin S-receptor-like serine/threonine-protein kinase At1g11300 [Magnolia sinica]